jgi:hypothetical protein
MDVREIIFHPQRWQPRGISVGAGAGMARPVERCNRSRRECGDPRPCDDVKRIVPASPSRQLTRGKALLATTKAIGSVTEVSPECLGPISPVHHLTTREFGVPSKY